MKCKSCGTVFDEGLFCPECGAKYEPDQEISEDNSRLTEEQRAKQELELAKAKADQERFAKEKAEQEAELLRQKNEAMRIEQEMQARKADIERQKQEELSRTFNGVVYNSVEEMNAARQTFDQQAAHNAAVKKANGKALWSLILGIAAWPLIFSMVGWLPAMIASIVLGIMALREKTEKRGMAIAGISISASIVVLTIIGTILAFL